MGREDEEVNVPQDIWTCNISIVEKIESCYIPH